MIGHDCSRRDQVMRKLNWPEDLVVLRIMMVMMFSQFRQLLLHVLKGCGSRKDLYVVNLPTADLIARKSLRLLQVAN